MMCITNSQDSKKKKKVCMCVHACVCVERDVKHMYAVLIFSASLLSYEHSVLIFSKLLQLWNFENKKLGNIQNKKWNTYMDKEALSANKKHKMPAFEQSLKSTETL